MSLLSTHFPDLSDQQLHQFELLTKSLEEWNEKINVISRKDIEHLEERHFIHSLSISKFISFKPGTKIIDVGTGGGFPGLPLAILFPECEFTLIDSIAKKIRVVNELKDLAKLKNVNAYQARAETINDKFDFVVSRAVAAFPKFYGWTKKLISKESYNELPNGIIYLKGGNLKPELASFGKRIQVTPLSEWYKEEWFEEKSIVYLKH
ncbi:MAG: 16S rRNA (guanine(527)-N(7))-methyltransferase RsmG [Bacteroidales bacterium]|jgi:16S rRNA (guanine527-N7)-methyltransferase|nr:16S rRNA (guanine(527)-N(7))-methyltransferase RsmG [Bacteroidales bacterium]